MKDRVGVMAVGLADRIGAAAELGACARAAEDDNLQSAGFDPSGYAPADEALMNDASCRQRWFWMQRTPGLDLPEAARRAFARLERDRR